VSLDSLGVDGSLSSDGSLGSDSFGEVELIGDGTQETVSGQGDVVVLTDLGAPNTDAAEQFQIDQNFEFDVEIVGTTNEVSDTFVAAGQTNAASDGESEIVSLDSLDTIDTNSANANAADGGGGQVTVQRGDTLSRIADSVAVQGVSSQQMMMALLNANQNAFINGNVNLVKAGAILRIPEGDELARLSQAQAVAQIGEQNQLWREYRDSVRGSAGTRVAAAPAATPPAPEPAPESESQPVEEESPVQLSEAAQRILDAAKNEAAGGRLDIVAQGDPTTTSASATADNIDADESAQLGEINQKLALAKEELASTRLESRDLGEQSEELQSTAENMESLVNIRQDEVARLEEALKTAAADAEAEKLAAAEAEQAAALAEAEKAAQAEAEKAAQAEAEKAAQAEAEKLAEAEQAVVDTDAEGISGDADTVPEENALTAAGETLPSVELVDNSDVPAEADAVEPVNIAGESTPWYMGLLQKYGKWLVIGIGGLCALLLGALLLGKRRKDTDDRLEFDDEVEFLDDDIDNVQLHADGDMGVAASGGGDSDGFK